MRGRGDGDRAGRSLVGRLVDLVEEEGPFMVLSVAAAVVVLVVAAVLAIAG